MLALTVVPLTGLEPVQILSLRCLPIPTQRHMKTVNSRQERTQERTELLIREMKTEKRLILLGT